MVRANGGDMSVLTSEFFVGYVPGMEAQRFDVDRSARLIPAACCPRATSSAKPLPTISTANALICIVFMLTSFRS